jgi:2-aminoethylphosphonate-pyruvate transaminase
VNVSDRVRRAAAMEPICHREPEYFDLQDDVRARLLKLFGLKEDWSAVLIAGSGTSAVETMILGGVPKGGTLLVVNNGVYGDRILKMAATAGITVDEVKFPWGTPADPAAVAMKAKGAAAIAVVHHETTTGQLNPIREIAAVARAAGARILVDAVSSLAGDPIDVAAYDGVAGTAGKCLQGLPGVSFIFARRACLVDAPRRSVYLDLAELSNKQDARNTPFTPAVPIVNAFREALREAAKETLKGRLARIARTAAFLRAGYEQIGLRAWLSHTQRSNTLTTLRLPTGRTYASIHDALKKKEFVIYAGQGSLEKESFRIANMGIIPPAAQKRLLVVLRQWVNA